MASFVNLSFSQRRPWRWLAMVVLTAFLTVQTSPYLALAVSFSPDRPGQAEILGLPDGQLLAQLDQLPKGTLSLPNFDSAVNGFEFSNRELVEAIDLNRNAQNWEVVLTEQLKQLFGTQVCVGGQASGCVLTAAAQGWLQTQLSRIDQGISEGMAAAVLDLWQPDFTVYTLTYDEEMTAKGIPLPPGTQAFFDYDPAFVDPGTRSTDELVTAFAQRNIPVTIAYEPLAPQSFTQSLALGPLVLESSGEAPIDQRVFQGSLGVRELAWDDGAAPVAIALQSNTAASLGAIR